jgi:hypothetical protein
MNQCVELRLPPEAGVTHLQLAPEKFVATLGKNAAAGPQPTYADNEQHGGQGVDNGSNE